MRCADRPFYNAALAGIAAYRNSAYEDALAHFSQAVKDDPTEPESHNNLGQVLVRFNRHDEALPHFECAVQLNPSHSVYHFNLAHALGDLER